MKHWFRYDIWFLIW